MQQARWIGLDLLSLILFVAIGRSTHHHGLALTGVLRTLWPFVVGLGGGWALVIRRHRSGTSLPDAVLIVVISVTVGMTLRVIAGQGTAVAFIIVALAFLSLTLGGWRLVARAWRQRRH